MPVRIACAIFAFATLFVLASPAWAGEVHYTVEFEQPKSTSSPKVAEEMASIISKRLRARFKAAGVKHYKISPNTRTVDVIVGGTFDSGWLTALATAPGSLEVRPVLEGGGPDWRELADMLPAEVEIRGDSARGHLWSATRAPLDRVLDRLSTTEGLKLAVAPDVLGWRTIVVGDLLASEADLEGATMAMAPTGAYNVSLAFSPAARARLAAPSSAGLQTWAVILDEEVVALVPRPGNDARLLGIAAPDRLGSDVAGQALWASAIVGRLAAPMPVRLALFKEQ
jgi:hypothetical protein